MKTLIAIAVVAIALALAGCGPKGPSMEKPSAEDTGVAQAGATEESVSDVESELDEMESLDEELDLSALDTLDEDLADI